jgi:large repetitive protein
MHEASVLPVRAARSGVRRVIRLGLSVLLLLGVAVGAELSLDVTNAFAATTPTWATGQYFSAIKGVPFCYDVSVSNSASLPLTAITAGTTPASVANYSVQDVNLAAGTAQVCGTNNNTAASKPVTIAPVATNSAGSNTDSVALWSQNECTWASSGATVSMFDSNQDLETAGSQSAFGQSITNGVVGGSTKDEPTCTGGVGVSESGGDGDAWTMNTANPLPTPTDSNPSAAQGDLPSSNLDLTSASDGSVGGCYGALNIFASTSTSAFGTSTASMTLPSSWVNGGDCAYGSLGSNSAGGNTDTAANGPTGDANCPPSQADVNAGLVSCGVILSSGNDENGSTNYTSLDLFYNGQPVPQTPTATLSTGGTAAGGTVSVTGGTNWWGAPDGAPNAAPYGDFQNSAANFYPVSAPSVYIGTSRGSAVPVVNSTVAIPANTYACTGAESTTVGPNPCTLTPGTPSGSFQVPSGLSPGTYNVYVDESNTSPLPGNGPNDSYQTSRGTSLGTAESASTLVVGTPPSITSAAGTTFTTGSAGSFTVTTSGSPNPSISESGGLDGLTFNDNGNGTATLSGTPTASGSFAITINASNGIAPAASQSFTLTVDAAPAITSASSTTFTTGSAGSFTVTSTGNPNAGLSETGTLPTGVSFVDNGNGTATLAGTPSVSGSFHLTITATNGVGNPASQSFTLTVDAAPAITSASSTTFIEGSAGSFAVTSTGNPTDALSETGTLPAGVGFADNGNGTATLSGTPTVSGSFSFSIKASNGVGSPATQSFSLTVDGAPAITSASSTTFTVGSAGSFTVTSTGNPTASLSESGSFPTGVTFTDNGNGTATLAGTPAAGTGGTYTATITATNGVGSPASQTFTLTVDAAPAITSASSTTFTEGSAGSFTVTSTGYPNAALSESGTLPAGVSLVDNGDGTATLAGTPTVSGSYPFTITANNGVGSSATQSFTLTVDGPPTITSTPGTTFAETVMSSFRVTTSATPTAALSETGALPDGVTFTDNGDGTASLAGTPATGSAGTYTLTIHASNGFAPDASQTFTLTVDETLQSPSITSASSANFGQGTAGSFTVTSTGTPTASLTETGPLPAGVTFTDNGDGTATLGGTPTAQGVFPLTITASNGVGSPATQSFTLTVQAAPAITSADSTTFTEGSAGSFTVTSTGTPTSALTESGSLPTGITFNDNVNGTATLAGTPAAGTRGSYVITIGASNGVAPDASQSFTLTVDAAPAITSTDSTTFTEGSAGSFSVETSASPTASLSETGTLPAGVSFTDNGDGSASLAGTPTSQGVYTFSIGATNGVAPDASQSFTLTVDAAPAITSADSATFTEGHAGSFTVTTTGTPTPSLSDPGTLPTGVTFTDNGDGTATLAGTPAAGTGGSYTFSIDATNGVAPDASQSFTLTVDAAPAITSADSTTFTEGSAGSSTVTTTGNPTAALSETGALPAGVSFSDNGDGTATLAGTPTAQGTFTFTVHAANGVAPNASQSFTLTVDAAPVITSADSKTFTVGSAGTFTVRSTGTPTAALTETGSLPGGVTFSDNGDGTATLAGTPASGTGGSYPITIGATNGVAPDASQSFTLTVDGAPSVTSANNTTFTEGSAGTFTVTSAGYPTASLTETGALPAGVTFTDNGDGTATLAGTPSAQGTFTLTIHAANGVAPNASQSFTLTVDAAPVITSADSTTFTEGKLSNFQVTATGTPTPTITESGALPSGISFSHGALTGTPSQTGTFALTFGATNGVGSPASQSFTLTVGTEPVFTSANNTTFTEGTAGSFTPTATGYPTPSITEFGNLPSGVTFGGGVLSGIPTQSGTFQIGFDATNGVGAGTVQDFTLTVNGLTITSTSPLPAATENVHYSDQLTASGGVLPLKWAKVGALPKGLALTKGGVLQGTVSPAHVAPGTYTIEVKCTDSTKKKHQTTTAHFSITINS